MSTHNHIEHFIQQHRDAFDDATPPSCVWESIAHQLDRWPAAGPEERYIAAHRPLLDNDLPSAQMWVRIATALDQNKQTIETFIREHRDAFDDQQPAPQAWHRIAQALPPARSAHLDHWRFLRWAAAAVALLLIGTGIGLWFGTQVTPTPTALPLSNLSPEYAELEGYFQREIQSRKSRLAQMTTYSQATLAEDLRQMDLAMAELQAELAQVPPANREPIVRAMIENYKARLAILERVLQYLERQDTAPPNSRKYDTEKI